MPDSAKKGARYFSGLGLFAVALIWGVAFVFVKVVVAEVSPLWLLAIRFTTAPVLLSLIFCRRFRLMDKRTLSAGIILGIFLFLAYYLQTVGIKYTTAGKNAFLTVIYVVLVPFLCWRMYRRRPSAFDWAAAVLALAGVGFLTLTGDLSLNIGDGLTLLCGVFFALHMAFIGKFASSHDPILLTIIQLITAGVLSLIIAPFTQAAPSLSVLMAPQILGGILFLTLLSTLLCFLLQNVCQKYTSATTAALLLSLESVFGVLASAVFLKEPLGPRMLFGCILIFFAIITSETHWEFLRRLKRQPAARPADKEIRRK